MEMTVFMFGVLYLEHVVVGKFWPLSVTGRQHRNNLSLYTLISRLVTLSCLFQQWQQHSEGSRKYSGWHRQHVWWSGWPAGRHVGVTSWNSWQPHRDKVPFLQRENMERSQQEIRMIPWLWYEQTQRDSGGLSTSEWINKSTFEDFLHNFSSILASFSTRALRLRTHTWECYWSKDKQQLRDRRPDVFVCVFSILSLKGMRVHFNHLLPVNV